MTTEERAVIEAAMRWSYHEISDKQFDGFVAALRESRKPKPRYTAVPPAGLISGVWDIRDGSRIVGQFFNFSEARHICSLLNAEAERAGGEDR